MHQKYNKLAGVANLILPIDVDKLWKTCQKLDWFQSTKLDLKR
jgi:hypothetical protein